MSLVTWWLHTPERVAPKMPTLLKAILVPWFVVGAAIALIPDLQKMPGGLRAVLGLPFALGVLWFAVGVLLSILDRTIAIARFLARHTPERR